MLNMDGSGDDKNDELQRFIRHHLKSRTSTASSSSTLVPNLLENDPNHRSKHNFKRFKQPKYAFTSKLVVKHDSDTVYDNGQIGGPLFWMNRASEIAEENRYKNAVLERKENGWGAPLKCVCGKWEHNCHNAACVYDRAKIKGSNISPKKRFIMPHEKMRNNIGTTKTSRKRTRKENWEQKIWERSQEIPVVFSSLDSNLFRRISKYIDFVIDHLKNNH
jgi:hypothetical protein